MEIVTNLPITESEFYANTTPKEMQMFISTHENNLESKNTMKCEEYVGIPTPLDDESMKAIEKLFKCMNVTYVIEKTLKNSVIYENQLRWMIYSYYLELTLSEDGEFTDLYPSKKLIPLFIQIRKENDTVLIYITIGISSITCFIGIAVMSSKIRKFCKQIIFHPNQYDVENFNRGEFISLNKVN